MGNSIKAAANKAADLRMGNVESNRLKNGECDQDMINRINAQNISAGGPGAAVDGQPSPNQAAPAASGAAAASPSS